MRFVFLAALLVGAAAFIPAGPVCRPGRTGQALSIRAAADDAESETPASESPAASGGFKGFGERPKKVVKQKTKAQLEREKYASAYDELKNKGVPEYAVYIKEKGGSDKDWKYVGSMAVPRTTKVDVAIFENESNLVKGAYKMYPRLKEKQEGGFEYGYNLKKFPDEPIKLAVPQDTAKNPVQQFIENVLNPLDASGVKP